jgi:hypothetical protein
LNISYTLSPGCWLAVNGAYFVGGGTIVDGLENNDEVEGGRIGATLALPLNRHHSLKIYAIRGFNAQRNADLDAIGIAWQYRWGGGF